MKYHHTLPYSSLFRPAALVALIVSSTGCYPWLHHDGDLSDGSRYAWWEAYGAGAMDIAASVGMYHTYGSRYRGMWTGAECEPGVPSSEHCAEGQWESLVLGPMQDDATGLFTLREADLRNGSMGFEGYGEYEGCVTELDLAVADLEGFDPSRRQRIEYAVADDVCGLYTGLEQGTYGAMHISEKDAATGRWVGAMVWPSDDDESAMSRPLREVALWHRAEANEEPEGVWIESCPAELAVSPPDDALIPEGGPAAYCTPSCMIEYLFPEHEDDQSWRAIGDCDQTL